MNPMKLLQIKNMWDGFVSRHPKFPNFLKAVSQNGIQEGTVLEVQITTPEGKTFTSNYKGTKRRRRITTVNYGFKKSGLIIKPAFSHYACFLLQRHIYHYADGRKQCGNQKS